MPWHSLALDVCQPFIYKNMDSFTDVTKGNNAIALPYGFNCTKGWDPITGAGNWLLALADWSVFVQ